MRASLKASLYCGNPTSSSQRNTQEWSRRCRGVLTWSPDILADIASCNFFLWSGWRMPSSLSRFWCVAWDKWWPESVQERNDEEYWLNPSTPSQFSRVSTRHLSKGSLGLWIKSIIKFYMKKLTNQWAKLFRLTKIHTIYTYTQSLRYSNLYCFSITCLK